MDDMAELYGLIMRLRELSAKKDELIDELMEIGRQLQAENEKLRESNAYLKETVEYYRDQYRDAVAHPM